MFRCRCHIFGKKITFFYCVFKEVPVATTKNLFLIFVCFAVNNPNSQNCFNKMENQFLPTSEIQANNKVLGIVWDRKSDYLVFSFENLIGSFNNTIPMKRNILSLIAKFYDTIGLIQPIIIKLKLLFQEVSITHADWDDPELSGQLKDKFDFIVKFAKLLTVVKGFQMFDCE